MIISAYWSLTTLSTVGFGDLYPATPFERLTGTIVIFCGYITFSLVNGTLLGTIEEVEKVFQDFGEHNNLERFFEALTYFNNDVPFDVDVRNKFFDFFEHKWKNDHQQFLQTEQDRLVLAQVPLEQQIRLYTEFIHRDFLINFRRLFRFRRNTSVMAENDAAYVSSKKKKA